MVSKKQLELLKAGISRLSEDKTSLLLAIHSGLSNSLDAPFIIDSEKGVRYGNTWILKCQTDKDPKSKQKKFSDTDVMQLSKWIIAHGVGFPDKPEDQLFYWTSSDQFSRILANMATFLTGANLVTRGSGKADKTFVIDDLFIAMKKHDPKTTRTRARHVANGISKFFGATVNCGLDLIFDKKLSYRSLRGKNKEMFASFLSEHKHTGNRLFNALFLSLPVDFPLKKLLLDGKAVVMSCRDALHGQDSDISDNQPRYELGSGSEAPCYSDSDQDTDPGNHIKEGPRDALMSDEIYKESVDTSDETFAADKGGAHNTPKVVESPETPGTSEITDTLDTPKATPVTSPLPKKPRRTLVQKAPTTRSKVIRLYFQNK
jgi:hypothetical protein